MADKFVLTRRDGNWLVEVDGIDVTNLVTEVEFSANHLGGMVKLTLFPEDVDIELPNVLLESIRSHQSHT